MIDKLQPPPSKSSDLTAGQRALGVSLIGLPPHPLDRCRNFDELLARFRTVSDQVLIVVANEINDLADRGLRQQPRYNTIAIMCNAVEQMDQEIAELYKRRRQPGCWLKPEVKQKPAQKTKPAPRQRIELKRK